MKSKKWIQRAKLRKDTLSKHLNIPVKENIPFALLEAIARADIGETIDNPTERGNRRFKVTRLLKKRARLALTLKNIRR